MLFFTKAFFHQRWIEAGPISPSTYVTISASPPLGASAPLLLSPEERRQQTAQHGEIVVAMIDNEATVKRLSLRGGEIWLLPENDDYQPIDGTNAQVLGRVTAVVRQY